MRLGHAGASKLSRDRLVTILPPEATDTFKPIKHASLVDEIHEALARRQLSVIKDEYAVSEDGMKLFGLLELTTSWEDFRFSIGIRNANDKSIHGIPYCDLCRLVVFADDLTIVKIEREGHLHHFHFHNRSATDCLAQKLAELRNQFAATNQ